MPQHVACLVAGFGRVLAWPGLAWAPAAHSLMSRRGARMRVAEGHFALLGNERVQRWVPAALAFC